VDFVPVPDPTRKTSTRNRPISSGTVRVGYTRGYVVDRHTSTSSSTSVTVALGQRCAVSRQYGKQDGGRRCRLSAAGAEENMLQAVGGILENDLE